MKTIQEVMEKYHLTKKEYALSEGGSYYTVENIEAAMTEYADQFKVKNLAQPDVSGLHKEEMMTAAEFFKRINSIPNYTAKNIKMKMKGGWVTIGEMSITT